MTVLEHLARYLWQCIAFEEYIIKLPTETLIYWGDDINFFLILICMYPFFFEFERIEVGQKKSFGIHETFLRQICL